MMEEKYIQRQKIWNEIKNIKGEIIPIIKI